MIIGTLLISVIGQHRVKGNSRTEQNKVYRRDLADKSSDERTGFILNEGIAKTSNASVGSESEFYRIY